MPVGLNSDSLNERRRGVSFFQTLQNENANITLENLGKPGETVKSWYQRLVKTPLNKEFENFSFIFNSKEWY